MFKMQIGLILFLSVFDLITSFRDIRVLHFGKCENYHDTPMIATENEIEISDGIHRKTVVEMNLEKDLEELEARLSIYKCDQKGCDNFWNDHEIKNICTENRLNDFDDILVRFIIDSTEPRIKSCPIKKGTYRTTFESGNAFFHNFSLVDGFWSVKWTLLDGKELLSCYECQVKVTE